MKGKPTRPDLRRRLRVVGVAAALGAAGAGGYLALSSGKAAAVPVHLVRAPAQGAAADASSSEPSSAHDADSVQSGDSGTTSGADTANAQAPADPAAPETDTAGGWADPAGSTGVNGDFNN
jgi:hypothetical protein